MRENYVEVISTGACEGRETGVGTCAKVQTRKTEPGQRRVVSSLTRRAVGENLVGRREIQARTLTRLSVERERLWPRDWPEL